jgi:DNA polymerase-4
MIRTIAHFDLDAFFCAVEETLDPGLRGKPFVVGASPGQRGVVASASYPARAFGVRSAMPTGQALRLCPELTFVHGHYSLYGEYSEKVMALVREAVPVAEQISIDEAFLDLTAHPDPGREVAARLQAEIGRRFDLPTSWGVATNKLVAKIATNVGKPAGLIVVPPGQEAAFLAGLPVGMLWGVGPKSQAELERAGVRTIGDLAGLPAEALRGLFGEHGTELAARARGEDDSPVEEGREAKSMSSETTFARDLSDSEELHRTLRSLTEDVGQRLREAGLAGVTVRVKLRWADFTTITRQRRLPQATDLDGEIYAAAAGLLEGAWKRGRPVRLLGVAVANLAPAVRQLGLFDRRWEEDARLLQAVDAIRSRYGWEALRRAADLEAGAHPGSKLRGRSAAERQGGGVEQDSESWGDVDPHEPGEGEP